MPSSTARARRLRPAGLLVLVALLAGACGSDRQAGVGVERLQADIAFGVEQPGDDLAPGGDPGAGAAVRPGLASTRAPVPGRRMQDQDRSFLDVLPPVAQRRECPPAAIDAFPAETAPLNAEEPPAEGLWRWRSQGTQRLTGVDQELPIDLFRNRLVRNVEVVNPTTWTFETVEREFSQTGPGDLVIRTFRVRTDARSSRANALAFEARTGEPDRGVSLVREERLDDDGNVVSVFAPIPAILILPLQVFPGEEYSTGGVDPRSGQAMQLQAKVVGRDRVDACGEILEGWLVEGTLTRTGAPARPYRYIVAPHLGGILLMEATEAVTAIGSYQIEHTIAQIEPDPLPEED